MEEARATWAARQEIMRQPSTVADRRTQALLDGVGAAMGHDFTPYVGRAARTPTEGEIYAQAAAEDMRRRTGKPPLWAERNQAGTGPPMQVARMLSFGMSQTGGGASIEHRGRSATQQVIAGSGRLPAPPGYHYMSTGVMMRDAD